MLVNASIGAAGAGFRPGTEAGGVWVDLGGFPYVGRRCRLRMLLRLDGET